ncbi:MAG: HAD-IA family hydrolase [SAR324 cluster bacterium]|nr:HAD-IA family hydrolase [SAR324 cluster bacterium]
MKSIPDKKLHIFDIDDTLTSTKYAYFSSYIDIASAEFKISETDALRIFEDLLLIYGSGNYTKIFKGFCTILGFEHLYDEVNRLSNLFEEKFWQRLKLEDGALTYLNKLQKKSYLLGIATNGYANSQKLKLSRLKINYFFKPAFRMISSEIGCSKPDPTMLKLILKNAKIPAEQAVYYGNNLSDFLAAKHADIDFVLYNGSQYKDDKVGELSLPYVIQSWQEII